MTRTHLLSALAAAALVACSAETETEPAPATSEISREDPEVAAALEALEKSSKADREEKLEAYLTAVRRAYGSESREYLGEAGRAELDIPVPSVEPMERKPPDLMPRPTAESPPE